MYFREIHIVNGLGQFDIMKNPNTAEMVNEQMCWKFFSSLPVKLIALAKELEWKLGLFYIETNKNC